MEEFVVGLLAFLAVTVVGFGVFGRPDQSRPTCAICRVDARRFAWENAPVCTCGARLDRAGAVRTRGRIRRPRVIVAGIVFCCATALFAVWTYTIRAQSLTWIDVLPVRVRVEGIRRGAEWALNSVERRQLSRVIGSAEALALLVGMDDALSALPATGTATAAVSELRDTMLETWSEDPEISDRILEIVTGLQVALATSTTLPDRGERARGTTIGFDVVLSSRMFFLRGTRGYDGCFVRVERVAIGEQVVPWTMTCYGRSPTRVVIDSASCAVQLPSDVSLGDTAITLDMLLVRSAATWAALGDEVIDSETLPDTWGVPARVVRVRRVVPITIVEPTLKVGENSEATVGAGARP